MIDATTTQTLTLTAGGRARSFPPAKGDTSVGAHRFCNVVLDGADGDLPPRAVIFDFVDGAWVLANVCDRYVVLHADGHPALSLPPGGRVGLTGVPFALSIPGTTVAAEVPVSFGSGDPDGSLGLTQSPWLRLAGGPPVRDVPAPPPPPVARPHGRRVALALA
ncbi:MAG: hypothetical protein ACRD0O_09270, partial [Acidimicrobiia bacterium]